MYCPYCKEEMKRVGRFEWQCQICGILFKEEYSCSKCGLKGK